MPLDELDLGEFLALHGPALEAAPARHNLILGLLERAKERPADHGFRLWSLGAPGACAIRTPGAGRGVLLGALTEAQARRLACALAGTDYPSVQGADETAHWFAAEAESQGKRFGKSEALRIHALERPPSRPAVPGAFRRIAPEDAGLLRAWTIAFIRDAGIPDSPPSPDEIEATIAKGRHFLWLLDGAPVAMAAMGRRFRGGAAIAPVYVLPEHRGKGLGGAITAVVADHIFAEGRRIACLYTDAGNPAANRCYAKLGFAPVCDAWVFRRLAD